MGLSGTRTIKVAFGGKTKTGAKARVRSHKRKIKTTNTKRKVHKREKIIVGPPFKITESVPNDLTRGNIRLRVDDPDEFERLRTIDPGREGFTKRIIGPKKGTQKPTMTQAILFSKKDFGRVNAIRLAKAKRKEFLND